MFRTPPHGRGVSRGTQATDESPRRPGPQTPKTPIRETHEYEGVDENGTPILRRVIRTPDNPIYANITNPDQRPPPPIPPKAGVGTNTTADATTTATTATTTTTSTTTTSTASTATTATTSSVSQPGTSTGGDSTVPPGPGPPPGTATGDQSASSGHSNRSQSTVQTNTGNPSGPATMGTRAQNLFDRYAQDARPITAQQNGENVIKVKSLTKYKDRLIATVKTYATRIKAYEEKDNIGTYEVASMQSAFFTLQRTIAEISDLYELILMYMAQTRSPADQRADVQTALTNIITEFTDLEAQVYADALNDADRPFTNITDEEYKAVLQGAQASMGQTSMPYNAPTQAIAAAPTIVMDRGVTNFIKPKPLNDNSKPSEIHAWSQAILSIFAMQKLDPTDLTLSQVFLQSYMDQALVNEIGRAHV